MELENLKRWHWALIGLLVGLGFAFFWQGADPDADRHLSQTEFERETMSKSRESGQPILQNVVVQPQVKDYLGKVVQVVTGARLRYDTKSKKEVKVPFAFIASVPYHVDRVPPSSTPQPTWTVSDFLAAAQKYSPVLKYRFGWESRPGTSMAIGAATGLIVVGGIWPTFLNLLIGAGLGGPPRPVEEKVNLAKVKNTRSAAVAPRKVIAIEDQQRLDALNESLESQLAAAGVFATSSAPAESPDDSVVGVPAPEVRPLSEVPVEPATVTAQAHEAKNEDFEELRKRYAAGDFYPVAKGKKE